MEQRLQNRRVLVAEDEYYIAQDVVAALRKLGAQVIGPFADLETVLETAMSEAIDVAVLDINMKGKTVLPVADALTARGIPFVFATGYASSAMPGNYTHIIRCEKPYAMDDLMAALARSLAGN